jgi:hypothetical protein
MTSIWRVNAPDETLLLHHAKGVVARKRSRPRSRTGYGKELLTAGSKAIRPSPTAGPVLAQKSMEGLAADAAAAFGTFRLAAASSQSVGGARPRGMLLIPCSAFQVYVDGTPTWPGEIPRYAELTNKQFTLN